MIKLDHVVFASPEQMMFVIEGMRNPLNSWDKGDSCCCPYEPECEGSCAMFIGPNDRDLMTRLSKAGTDHRKFMRMMSVYVRITAPLYWWKEFDTYKVGTVANSCSTMHKIQAKEFTLDDFSTDHLLPINIDTLLDTIKHLNECRDLYLGYDGFKFKYGDHDKKDIWWQMIQLLPSSYNQTRNVMLNYEVLANMYHSRKNHKLDEWVKFCKWIETIPNSDLITGEEK